ncbi:MAG: hypothetical protein Q4B42_05715 [Oscillospiraceae bacterium]|nr:hypothetical protein [Oscillospiraceae bacterium]
MTKKILRTAACLLIACLCLAMGLASVFAVDLEFTVIISPGDHGTFNQNELNKYLDEKKNEPDNHFDYYWTSGGAKASLVIKPTVEINSWINEIYFTSTNSLSVDSGYQYGGGLDNIVIHPTMGKTSYTAEYIALSSDAVPYTVRYIVSGFGYDISQPVLSYAGGNTELTALGLSARTITGYTLVSSPTLTGRTLADLGEDEELLYQYTHDGEDDTIIRTYGEDTVVTTTVTVGGGGAAAAAAEEVGEPEEIEEEPVPLEETPTPTTEPEEIPEETVPLAPAESESSGLSGGAIAGIVGGVLLAGGAIALIAGRKRSRGRR